MGRMNFPSPESHVALESDHSFPVGLVALINAHKSSDVEPVPKRRRLDDVDDSTAADGHPWILLRRIKIRVTFRGKSSLGPLNYSADQGKGVPLTFKSCQMNESRISESVSAATLHFQYNIPDNKTESFSTSPLSDSKGFNVLRAFDAGCSFAKSSTKKPCQTSISLVHAFDAVCIFQMDIKWKDSELFEDIPTGNSIYAFLKLITPGSNSDTIGAWSPRDFYDNVHVPNKDDEGYKSLDVTEIQSRLFDFQKRTVQWMLQREGVDIAGRSIDQKVHVSKESQGWHVSPSVSHKQVYVNTWLGLVTTHESLMHDPYTEVSGGILAEEMGLGKTVEIIAIVLRNKRDLSDVRNSPRIDLPSTTATLIVAPDSIIEQWASEIGLHAPSLRALLYPGVKGGGKKKEEELLDRIQESDIVLCTYNTLASEVHYARDPPDRNTRNKKSWERERPRSPLVQLHWWRCVLDECQMIQSGVSSAAEVALQIPRQHAWAVSGTPLRKDPGDVYGLLRFLRLLPYSWSPKTWTRLLDEYQNIFKDLVRRVVLRHTKHIVKDELELPPQKRVISTISLTQIEEQHYSNNFDRMCQKVGLNRDGSPISEDWDPNSPAVIEQMRMWLTSLRQLCLHPDVGGRNMRALGGRVQDVLRTVEDVLQIMVDQNDTQVRTDERAYYLVRLRRGQLFEVEQKIHEALSIWEDILPQIQNSVQKTRLELSKIDSETTDDEGDDAVVSSNDHTEKSRLGQTRTRLRLLLELEHMVQFFIGNAYFQIKENKEITEPESEEFHRLERLEVSQYDAAKVIRLEMLAEPSELVHKLLSDITYVPKQEKRIPLGPRRPGTSEMIELARQGLPRIEERGGIESGRIFDELDQFAEYYNPLMDQILQWRQALIELLSKPLVDYASDEIQGDEYEVSMREQDEVYTRMDIFRASVEDLEEILTGQENMLIKSEAKNWAKLAREGKGHASGLMIELLNLRQSLKPDRQLGSIRGTLAKLRMAANSLYQGDSRDERRKIEVHLMKSVESKFRTVLNGLDGVKRYLHGDVTLFVELQNSRLEFYRQLQHISDLVIPWPDIDQEGLELETETNEIVQAQRIAKKQKQIGLARSKLDTEEAQLQTSIRKKTSQARYLEHLKKASSLGDERKCIICQDEQYEIGVLTGCGHLFCKDCINVWLASHAKCPQCRATIRTRSELYQITYKPQQLRMEEEEVSHGSSDAMDTGIDGSAKVTSIYSQISTQQLNEIKSVELPRGFGTKIDFIARHIIWLRGSDASKTVIFSQFRQFCPGSLAKAFDQIGIKYAVIGGHVGVDKFKYDPSVECLLMHAGSQASGMNLVNASHVLLCEPLVNTALELQAIARVHRIGQHRPTTIWMYLIEGTVEKAIYDLSVERRLDHIGKQKKLQTNGIPRVARSDEDVEAVDAEQMTDRPLVTLLSKDQRSGEIVRKDDLWQCLFGNAQPRRGLPELDFQEDRAINIDSDEEMLDD